MAFKPNYRRDRARIVPDPPEATTLGFPDAERSFSARAFRIAKARRGWLTRPHAGLLFPQAGT